MTVEKSRKKYYDAYTLVKQSEKISGVLDGTPFLVYFAENVYHKLGGNLPTARTMNGFKTIMERGEVTERSGFVGVCPCGIWKQRVFHEATGKRLWECGLCHHSGVCPEI